MKTEHNETNSVLTEKLLAIAAESANLEPAEVLEYILAPEWEANKGWQWEMYVERRVRALWNDLCTEGKLLAFIAAVARVQEAGRCQFLRLR